MQALVSLSSLILTIIILMVQWLLPMLNLHIALNRENLLLENSQALIDAQRLDSNNTIAKLETLNLNGLKINKVTQDSQGDYIIYRINFNHKNLFANRFLQASDLSKPKTLTLLADKL